MKIYSSHLKQGAVPVMVAEGFSWGAALLGGLWLLWQRAWVPAVLLLLLDLLADRVLGTKWYAGAMLLGLAILQGMFGRDILRWWLSVLGYTHGPTVAATGGPDAALARLLTERPELMRGLG